MSVDEFDETFGLSFELDADALRELDRLESSNKASTTSFKRPGNLALSDETFDQFSFELDADALRELDRLESSNNAPTTSFTRQKTLLGTIVQPKPPRTLTKAVSHPVPRAQPTQRMRKSKSWDHKAISTLLEKSLSKKSRPHDDEEDNVEFIQFPNVRNSANTHSARPMTQMKLEVDLLAAKNWIYPIDKPKRDYQFNIIRKALFENCLVALPTGLGKTFIAAVIMLNYYNWFPRGKIVFVAPTKPLVNQQMMACHGICGIPQEDCVVLNGEVSRGARTQKWIDQRIFFATPQTLQNDLISGTCDPANIVLLVIDEAHRATGNHSSAQVVKLLMQRNPFFRLLALTATPGSTLDKVQDIIDALRISHIEIRHEGSIDLQKYIHRKEIKEYVVQPGGQISEIRDVLLKAMESLHTPLRQRGLLAYQSTEKLKPYSCTVLLKDQNVRHGGDSYSLLADLGNVARAMGALLEASVEMCKRILSELMEERRTRKGGTQKGSDHVRAALSLLDKYTTSSQATHPKMERLKAITLEYFSKSSGEIDPTEQPKMMVFASLRECVDELEAYLNQEGPLLRATKFIGQGTDARGSKGMGQKKQLEVIEKFKSGEFNILVSTSVGEEGLDIGEVESIVFYDCGKEPVRSLQRAGRTGRRKKGWIHLLEAEGREEGNYKEAFAVYHGVQDLIARGTLIELYGDVPRLIPDSIKPELLEMPLSPQPFVQEQRQKKGKPSAAKRGTKRKRDADPMRNVPVGASTTFVKAGELKGATSSINARELLRLDVESETSEDDEDIALIFSKRATVQGKDDRRQPLSLDNGQTSNMVVDISSDEDTPSKEVPDTPQQYEKCITVPPRPQIVTTSRIPDAAWLLSSPNSSPAPNSLPPPERRASRRPRQQVITSSPAPTPLEQTTHTVNDLVDVEAEVSGTDSGDEANSALEEETAEDREFLIPLPETQVSPSYPQTQVYHQSMLTQPSYSTTGPVFHSRPKKKARLIHHESSRRRAGVSSSPPAARSDDDYEYDGFVVEDDEMIV